MYAVYSNKKKCFFLYFLRLFYVKNIAKIPIINFQKKNIFQKMT